MSDSKQPFTTKPDILISDVDIKDMSHAKERPAHVPQGGKVQRIAGQNIVTVDISSEKSVNTYAPGRLHDTKGIKYSNVISGLDAAAQKNSRFRISDLARGPLSVEAEEEERIEAEVEARLAVRLQELRIHAEQAAYQAGFDAGKVEAKSEVLAEAAPKLETLDRLLAEFDAMRSEIFKANERVLLQMVNQLARMVVARELKEDQEYVRRLATLLIERLGTRENIKIYVGEKEFSTAEELKAGLAQSLGQLKNISVELDRGVTGAGCRVETEFGEVDARVEIQLQNIAQGLGAESK